MQVHALSKFFFMGEYYALLLKAEPAYFMSLLATTTIDNNTAGRRYISPLNRAPLVRVNKSLHSGASTATKKHRKEVTERHNPIGHHWYGSNFNYKEPSVTSEKLERRNEGNYAAKNLHEYL